MTSERFIAPSGNLSLAWAQVLLRLLDRGVRDLGPVIVTVTEFEPSGEPKEIEDIRRALDTDLAANDRNSVHTVANTIFPVALWRPGQANEEVALYSRYEAIWPKVQRCRGNQHGVYFRRLTAFRPNNDVRYEPVNQIATIIANLKNGLHRRSALQAGIFDPVKDHRPTPILGFPCLQQVAFAPISDTGLSVTGFYALQHQYEKAYGNYLGLSRLGRFVAAQAGLQLRQVNCIAAAVKIGDGKSKGSLGDLALQLARHTGAPPTSETVS